MPLPLAEGQAEPTQIKSAGIRYCEPYWISVSITIPSSRKRKVDDDDTTDAATHLATYQEALLALSKDRKASKWTRPTIQWWLQQLQTVPSTVCLKNGTPISPSDRIHLSEKNSDAKTNRLTLCSRFHYHEQCIVDSPVSKIYEDAQYFVVNKPAGVDVLQNPAAGRVRHSLPGIVKTDIQYDAPVMPAHRLDTPVSGVVCCGKTKSDVKRLSRRIELRETTKIYVARVLVSKGGMPTLPLTIEAPLNFDKATSLAFVDQEHGKASKTTVVECQRIMEEGDVRTAIVTIRIETGRKHQIRIHLQHVGLPIANDDRYGGTRLGSNALRAFENPSKELLDCLAQHRVEGCEYCDYERDILGSMPSSDTDNKQKLGPVVNTGIWLHSWKYEFPTLGLKFEAPLPDWAKGEEVSP